jgi:hypothetical protein
MDFAVFDKGSVIAEIINCEDGFYHRSCFPRHHERKEEYYHRNVMPHKCRVLGPYILAQTLQCSARRHRSRLHQVARWALACYITY